MSDLIDRQALLRQIDIDSDGEPGYYGDTWKFIDTIKRMPSALGTNLAEVGTDCMRLIRNFIKMTPPVRQEPDRPGSNVPKQPTVPPMPKGDPDRTGYKMYPDYMTVWKYLHQLPSAQPEIIRCRNCKFASGDSRICMKFGHSPIGELDFCSFAERREVTT